MRTGPLRFLKDMLAGARLFWRKAFFIRKVLKGSIDTEDRCPGMQCGFCRLPGWSLGASGSSRRPECVRFAGQGRPATAFHPDQCSTRGLACLHDQGYPRRLARSAPILYPCVGAGFTPARFRAASSHSHCQELLSSAEMSGCASRLRRNWEMAGNSRGARFFYPFLYIRERGRHEKQDSRLTRAIPENLRRRGRA